MAKPTNPVTPAQAEFVFDEKAFPGRFNLRVEEVMEWLACGRSHIVRLIDDGSFPNARDIRRTGTAHACWRIPRADVLAFMEKRNSGTYVPEPKDNAC